MAKKQIDLGLTGLDELFMDDKERAESKLPMENHIADTFTDCLFEPSGDAAIVQFFQEAVLFAVQQVRKVILNNFLRKLLGKRLYAIPKRSVKIVLEPALQGMGRRNVF